MDIKSNEVKKYIIVGGAIKQDCIPEVVFFVGNTRTQWMDYTNNNVNNYAMYFDTLKAARHYINNGIDKRLFIRSDEYKVTKCIGYKVNVSVDVLAKREKERFIEDGIGKIYDRLTKLTIVVYEPWPIGSDLSATIPFDIIPTLTKRDAVALMKLLTKMYKGVIK